MWVLYLGAVPHHHLLPKARWSPMFAGRQEARILIFILWESCFLRSAFPQVYVNFVPSRRNKDWNDYYTVTGLLFLISIHARMHGCLKQEGKPSTLKIMFISAHLTESWENSELWGLHQGGRLAELRARRIYPNHVYKGSCIETVWVNIYSRAFKKGEITQTAL